MANGLVKSTTFQFFLLSNLFSFLIFFLKNRINTENLIEIKITYENYFIIFFKFSLIYFPRIST